MIPKIIHYCWFGGNPKPELIESCIASWHKYCPDWEIIEWNEDNWDVNCFQYTREAYDAGKWAFVSDVARLDIVGAYGGVYLDTDIELLAPIDKLLENNAFFAFETARNLNSGLGFGAEKGHPAMRECLSDYENRHFIVNGKMDQIPCPRINTKSLCRAFPSLERNGQPQIIDGTIFLSPGEYSKYMKNHAAASWTDFKEDGYEHIYKPSKLKDLLRTPSNYTFIEKHFGEKAVHIYEILSYDLLEFGLGYYTRRLIKKVRKKIRLQ